ncbi:hypothetical protein TcWFU_009695 [Taenia crassiceps]|uniref:Uncharacterized protein n=1 Tax=Taenia crassiceps TaxID=6207 RepID=A0ABR4QNK6_9CEST
MWKKVQPLGYSIDLEVGRPSSSFSPPLPRPFPFCSLPSSRSLSLSLKVESYKKGVLQICSPRAKASLAKHTRRAPICWPLKLEEVEEDEAKVEKEEGERRRGLVQNTSPNAHLGKD